MLLAIDTATRVMSLALHDGQTLIAEQTWHSHNNHSVQLAPAIETMLNNTGLEMAALRAIAVSVGPGSYTGLRIGIALAKGMAAAHQLPLVGVTTLDTIAAAQPYYAGSALIVAVSAGRSRVIAGIYRWYRGRWVNRGEPHLLDWETLIDSVDGSAAVTGEIDPEAEALLHAAREHGKTITLVPAAYRLRRAGFLAEAAWSRIREFDDVRQAHFPPAELVPVYIQTKDSP
ncbi:MAG: tRNA (adenosine(37)-N6)-threonylcarbamoyltransferase complex dimerization subunit type 1 TsaB [Chloroflexi bacterium]|nr:MAG: tRNA (adenosine(37)-N6)-threonylcarbamoyltransferase complex dimerization subunit type 1 TsaB [Chloroflexota bacterium]